ncbi:hypothetical protein KYK29_17105 [Shinella daejeonensis]|uniref:hypothetical protein n=1 Tax=Shinella daejeonensis TaxID=659017 RepID=UPI0020C7DE67|nr:hypothetical protein [Shinella daejeonensis]MCP8896647.1 hypothetical protein [Shinella daejeonensis]
MIAARDAKDLTDEDIDLAREPDVDPAFARRMKIACDKIRDMPADKGRSTWIMQQMKMNGINVSLQTAYRWYHGRGRPRNQKLLMLAKVLGVDSAWLANGDIPELDFAEKKHFNAAADASVNVVMGFVQMAGWQCAFPEEDDPNRDAVHFYSIIKGKQHRFHVSYGLKEDDGSYVFSAPVAHEKCTVVGLIETKPLHVELLQIPSEAIEAAGSARTGSIRVEIVKSGSAWVSKSHKVQRIGNFSQSLI